VRTTVSTLLTANMVSFTIPNKNFERFSDRYNRNFLFFLVQQQQLVLLLFLVNTKTSSPSAKRSLFDDSLRSTEWKIRIENNMLLSVVAS
jgi:hypothetical protein